MFKNKHLSVGQGPHTFEATVTFLRMCGSVTGKGFYRSAMFYWVPITDTLSNYLFLVVGNK